MKEYKIRSINIKGFKSIDSEGVNIPLGDINVFIGANGVGKSNVISFFEMLEAITLGKFQHYVRVNGGANTVLYYGSRKTKIINVELIYNDESNNELIYNSDLTLKIGDELFISNEELNLSDGAPMYGNYIYKTNNAALESFVFNERIYESKIQNKNLEYLKNFRLFQFADTSTNSKMRNSVYINDGRKLHSDGGNLAAFLYTLKNQKENLKYYQRIVKYIKMVMPQFSDFELLPDAINPKNITLNWYDSESEYLFGPHQISDGSLRFMALATLLLQPPTTLPSLIVIDEPELGLHPAAISLLASMIHTASQHCQLVLATQSTTLIDEFEAKHIIVVEREGNHSTFKRLNTDDMQDWLQRYSLSEIWDKNIIGGRP